MEVLDFHYIPQCSSPGCDNAARFKIAALWSNGTSRELKNYGLACDEHKQAQFDRACRNCERILPAEGESIGEIGVYALEPGRADLELQRLPEITP